MPRQKPGYVPAGWLSHSRIAESRARRRRASPTHPPAPLILKVSKFLLLLGSVLSWRGSGCVFEGTNDWMDWVEDG